MREFIRNELKGWEKKELMWLLIVTVVMLGIPIYLKDTMIGVIAGITGAWCVVLTGKGKLSCYIFGVINILLYGYLAYSAKYYGDFMLNILYYLPMQFVGFSMWKKSMDGEQTEVMAVKLTTMGKLKLLGASLIIIFLYRAVLLQLGGSLTYVDSSTTVLSIVAMWLSVKRYAEQWMLWIVVNVLSIVMWGVFYMSSGESVAILIMWVVYLINSIIMYVKWTKQSNSMGGAESVNV